MPVTRFLVRQPSRSGGITVRLVEGDPQSVVIRFFDDDGARPLRGRAAQDRAAVQPGGLPPGASPARSATSASRPGPSSTTPPRSRPRSTSTPSLEQAGFKVVVDYGYGSTSFVMPNVLSKLGRRRAGGQPVRLHRGGHGLRPGAHAEQVAELVRASGAHLGAVIDPDGEHLTLIDDEGHVLTDTEAPARPPDPRAPTTSSATGSRCRCRHDPTRRAIVAAEGHPRSGGRSCRRRRSWTRPPRTASASPPASTAASSSRASCPPSTPPPPS